MLRNVRDDTYMVKAIVNNDSAVGYVSQNIIIPLRPSYISIKIEDAIIHAFKLHINGFDIDYCTQVYGINPLSIEFKINPEVYKDRKDDPIIRFAFKTSTLDVPFKLRVHAWMDYYYLQNKLFSI